MARVSRLLLAVLLVATPLTAGCDFSDWYDQMGTLRVELLPVGPTNTSLSDLRSAKVAIYSLSVKQFQFLDQKEFTFGQEPLIVDLVEKGTRGERVPMAQFKLNIRQIEHITLRLDVLEAQHASGEPIAICHEDQPVPEFPCFFVPRGGVFRFLDRTFSVPRGGTAIFAFPLEVQKVTVSGDTEYFLNMDPNKATIDNKL